MLHFARWKIATNIGILLLGLLFALPNVLPQGVRQSLPGFVPSKTINLGLDLQGGVHLLLGIDTEALIAERMTNLKVDIRRTLRNQEENIRIQHGVEVRGSRADIYITRTDEVDQALKLLRELARPVSLNLLGTGQQGVEFTIEKIDDHTIQLQFTEAALDNLVRRSVDQTIEVIRRRIDEDGTKEPTIQRQGADRVIVQVPGATNAQEVKDRIEKTAKLTFQMVYSDSISDIEAAQQGRTFRDAVLLPTERPDEPYILLDEEVTLTGDMLIDSQPSFDQQSQPAVSFRLNGRGARIFAKVTAENVNKRFAIVLDGRVISAPNIQGPIPGGSGIITGNFTVESANELALLLRSGALPAPIKVEEERTLGPDLGKDSIEKGKTAAVIGAVAVLVFIILSYGRFGIYANIALFGNVTLILGALSLLQATLTLPGIAGIILTIGMAVDANVLIFERIREEIRSGKTPLNAVESGYSRALSAILDANITTFIAAMILFFIGTGPVKGFSVTLGIGILTSVFTAFTVTRMMVVFWLHRRRPDFLPL